MPLEPGYLAFVEDQLQADTAWLKALEDGAAQGSPIEQAAAEQHGGIVRERIRQWRRVLAGTARARFAGRHR